MSHADSRRSGGPVELDRAECLEMLGSAPVGRLAFCTIDGPVVHPVNYVMHDGDVVFRTAPHSLAAQQVNGEPVAFEVDRLDDLSESGWSVLVQGRATYVDFPADLPRDARPEPWADGIRSLFVRITPRSITGRRVGP
jgi:uncharacterized protein